MATIADAKDFEQSLLTNHNTILSYPQYNIPEHQGFEDLFSTVKHNDLPKRMELQKVWDNGDIESLEIYLQQTDKEVLDPPKMIGIGLLKIHCDRDSTGSNVTHRSVVVENENVYLKSYHHLDFEKSRNDYGLRDIDYIWSIMNCKEGSLRGGKSGAKILKTEDNRFVVKEIEKIEVKSFLKIAEKYFDHCGKPENKTFISVIFGLYEVQTHGKKKNVMVMKEVFNGKKMTQTYDLKGIADRSDSTGEVGWDAEFLQESIKLKEECRNNMTKILQDDTQFLKDQHVMDYSLLVGVDQVNSEVLLGLIDFLREYTWDKKLETWVKKIMKCVKLRKAEATVICPSAYKNRLDNFVDLYVK